MVDEGRYGGGGGMEGRVGDRERLGCFGLVVRKVWMETRGFGGVDFHGVIFKHFHSLMALMFGLFVVYQRLCATLL